MRIILWVWINETKSTWLLINYLCVLLSMIQGFLPSLCFVIIIIRIIFLLLSFLILFNDTAFTKVPCYSETSFDFLFILKYFCHKVLLTAILTLTLLIPYSCFGCFTIINFSLNLLKLLDFGYKVLVLHVLIKLLKFLF